MSTGSFPVMDIAREFGVDYGDVLVTVMSFRHAHNQQKVTHERLFDAFFAIQRIEEAIESSADDDALATKRKLAFGRAVEEHVVGRRL